MKVGDRFSLVSTAFSFEGEGVAEHGGRRVHVRRFFPGETGTVRIDHVDRQGPKAFGTLKVLESPHAGRRTAPCAAHEAHDLGRCGGCALMELTVPAQRELKRQMLAELGLPVAALEADDVSPEAMAYRWSSKRIVFGRVGAVRLGSRAHGTAKPAEMAGCLVDHGLLLAAFDEVAVAASDAGIAPYDRGHGELRYVWAKTNGREVLVTLVTATEDEASVRRVAEGITGVAGVHWSVQGAEGNAMRGEAPTLLRGAAELELDVDGVRLPMGPLGFLQPNPRTARLAYGALVGDAPGSPEGPPPAGMGRALAFDVYAGTGVTTALLRRRFERVVPCEAFPESAARLGVAPEAAETFLSRMVAEGAHPDLVVLNPPRAGLGGAAAPLLSLGAPEVRIMSCHPASLRRDLDALAAAYDLTWARAFDTLPHTPHVELVVGLRRRASPRR